MITYKTGDALDFSDIKQNAIIAHVCNDIGGWGRGFVVSVSQKCPVVEHAYRAWSKGQWDCDFTFKLGNTQFVQTHSDIWFANMVAQHDIKTIDGIQPIRYDALSKCLVDVNKFAIANNAVIRMPRIGCGLAGGSWSVVEALINNNITVDVVVYDFDTGDSRTIKWRK